MAKGQVIFLKLSFCVLQFTHREHTQQIVLFLLSPERYESGFSPLFYARRTERAKERTRETVFCSSFLFFSFLFTDAETTRMKLPIVSAIVQKKRRRKLKRKI
jgi:hypothetical protein